jgi:hypothetical protein
MAIANLVVKVSGQVADLEADLKKTTTLLGDFGKNFDTVSSKASKAQEAVNKSFSGEKIITQAAQIVTAVEKIGGASKLTVDEQDRVNKSVSAAIDKYAALGQTAPAAMLALAQATEKVPNSKVTDFFDDLGKHIIASAAGFISAQAVIGGVEKAFEGLTEFVKSSVEAYAESEAASKKLTTALQAQGNATPTVIGRFKDLSEQFQRTTVYDNDLVTSMEALLVQVGNVAPAQMEKALTAATDLASGLGIDLQTATLLVGKAFEGETGTLKRYGIVIDEAKLKTQGVSAVLDGIQQKFGGQAQAEIDTYAGKIKQLANEWEDLKKAVGESVVNDDVLKLALREVTDAVRDANGQASAAKPSFLELGVAFLGGTPGMIEAAHALEEWSKRANEAAEGAKKYQNELQSMDQFMNRVRQDLAASAPVAPIDLSKLLAEARALQDALPHLSAAQRDVIDAFDKAGLSAKEIADKLHISEAAVKAETDAHHKAVDAIHQHADAIQQLADRYSHADLDKKAIDIAQAFQLLAREGKVTPELLKQFGADAADIIVKGGHVPQLLEDIAFLTDSLHEPLTQSDIDWKNVGRTLRTEVSPSFSEVERHLIELHPEMEKTISQLHEIFSPSRVGIGDQFKNIGTQVTSDGQLAKQALDDIKRKQDEWHRAIDETSRALHEIADSSGGAFGNIIADIANVVDAWRAAERAAEDYAKATTAAGKAAAILEGVGAVAQATSQGSTASRTVGGALAGAQLGASIGGKVAPVAGSIIGAGIGALVGFIRGHIADSHANYQIQQLQQQLSQTYGGMQNLIALSGDLGVSLYTAFGHNGQKGLAQLQDKLTQFQQQLSALQQQAEQYGLTWQDLAKPSDRQNAFDQMALSLLKTEDGLVRLGYDSKSVLTKMAGDFNSLIQHAIDAGVKIPAGLQPILDQLAQMGLLTDETKRKLLGLSTVSLDGGTFDDVIAAAQRYGLTLDQLGPKVNQLNIDQVSQQIAQDWKLLTSDGEDVNAVMQAMRAKVQEVVTAALKFGDSIPASMQPVIDAMIHAGLLTDQFGKTLTDTSQIQWEKPLTASIDDLVTKIGELIDVLTHGLGGALDGLPKDVDIGIHTHYDQTGTPPGVGNAPNGVPTVSTGGVVLQHGVMRFADGGFVPRGTDTVPAMLTPGELILNATQQADLSRSLRKRNGVTVVNYISALDGASVQRVVASREFSESLVRAFRLNLNGIAEALN